MTGKISSGNTTPHLPPSPGDGRTRSRGSKSSTSSPPADLDSLGYNPLDKRPRQTVCLVKPGSITGQDFDDDIIEVKPPSESGSSRPPESTASVHSMSPEAWDIDGTQAPVESSSQPSEPVESIEDDRADKILQVLQSGVRLTGLPPVVERDGRTSRKAVVAPVKSWSCRGGPGMDAASATEAIAAGFERIQRSGTSVLRQSERQVARITGRLANTDLLARLLVAKGLNPRRGLLAQAAYDFEVDCPDNDRISRIRLFYDGACIFLAVAPPDVLELPDAPANVKQPRSATPSGWDRLDLPGPPRVAPFERWSRAMRDGLDDDTVSMLLAGIVKDISTGDARQLALSSRTVQFVSGQIPDTDTLLEFDRAPGDHITEARLLRGDVAAVVGVAPARLT